MTDEIRQLIKEALRAVDYDKIVLFGSNVVRTALEEGVVLQ